MVLHTVDGERQRETETREPDVVDGKAADLNIHHKRAADKHKYSTIGYQASGQKVVTDFATLSKGTSAGAKPRTALKQVLFSQGVSDKASEERSQLDGLKQVLEAFSLSEDLRWRWNEESQGTTLETSWTDIVQSHSTMSKMQRHQQEALWEFVYTELTFINKLLIIKDLVIAALVQLHQKGFLQEVTPEELFSNLPSILEAHQQFWKEVVYPMLQEARKTGKPFDPMSLDPGCLQFHKRFSSYHEYCWKEEDNLEFSRRQMENNLHFSTYVQWVENHPQGDRMRLGDMQAKPHQRITKYPLLLKAVLKHTQDPHVEHTLRCMLFSVNNFLELINDYLRLKDEQLALNISAQRLDGYEVDGLNEEIDRHVREVCKFDLTCPIKGVDSEVVRKLLREGNLKVRGRKDSKLELVALLFSDVLLLTKVQKKTERLKVVRPPLALDRMYCIPLKDGYSFLLVEVGELQSAMNVVILVASTSENCSIWVSTIHQAKETLRQLREAEHNRQETETNQQNENPVKEAMTDDVETEEQPVAQPGMETSMDESTDDTFISNSINGYPSPSPSFSATSSPSRSDGDRDTDLEEVEVARPKALSVSQGWKEQLVDGDEDEQGNSVFVEGVNVDWPGWCFDDEEVNDRLRPSTNGFLEEINRSLALYGIGELSEQEDGECSQV
ncbi:pleckstrin homology domain-containing family G member 6 [Pelmatolapia mariae]|uniref:pleckstrin homology domain-containing family G member 6 n=1 Tax=Pelmatolapia mariae TaxID=158779 RepID=UPI002FE62149